MSVYTVDAATVHHKRSCESRKSLQAAVQSGVSKEELMSVPTELL